MMAHVVRIDAANTHGWQARFSPTPANEGWESKLFSDSLHGGKRKAKRAANDYLLERLREEGLEGYPVGRRRGLMFLDDPDRLCSNNTSGRTGVYRSRLKRVNPSGSETVQYYWAAHYSIGPKGQRTSRSKRFYYGTKRTEEEAMELAMRFREEWEDAFLEGGTREVRRFFKEWSNE